MTAIPPLTDAEIWDSDVIMELNAELQLSFTDIVRFVRAVEAEQKVQLALAQPQKPE